MHHFKAAIFDMDGLLLDSEKLALNAFQAACLEFDLGDRTDLFMQCVGTNATLGTSILKNGLTGLMDFNEFVQSFEQKYTKLTQHSPVPLKAGAQILLEHLKSIGVPMAIATSSKTESANRKLKGSGIVDYFDFIVGGEQVSKSKPEPEIYLKTASLLCVDPSVCIAFEDSPNGVKAAVAADMTVVQIPDLIEPDDNLLKIGHIVLSSLADVVNYDFLS